jgi:hypothetical protein
MMTPEGKVKEKVKKLLRQHNAYFHMPVGGGMGKPSLDFIGCHNGRFFAIETKAGNGKPTPRQEGTIREIQLSKGPAFVVNEFSGWEELELWLRAGM